MLFNDYLINQNKFNINHEITKEDISICYNIEMFNEEIGYGKETIYNYTNYSPKYNFAQNFLI